MNNFVKHSKANFNEINLSKTFEFSCLNMLIVFNCFNLFEVELWRKIAFEKYQIFVLHKKNKTQTLQEDLQL